ncbi:hypothetical protein WN55_02827 [Dufourea novaeangliae]|uniref:Uncharacterized protein n=1 Tax=Dufourea novaeangliae TaxID=178035 RepID=A0A154PI65_DUFNO|nr:hypothetical protein WN55_02827 [Dufourea novaeangliae]
MDENNCQYSSQLPTEIQSRKTHSVVQRGYTFNLHKVLQNFNKTNITEEKIMNDFHPQTETFKNQQIKSKSNEHFFIASQIFPNKDKLTEHTESNQQNYVNTKTNITLHNFLKLPLQTFSANIQNQQSNTNSNQTAKNRTDFYKVPCINHRNDPYVETLNSIQKSTIIPLTRTSTTVTNVTTELPIYALTLSLKPLIPRELDYDPYYPKFTSTESYYSSSRIPNKLPYVKTILQKSWSNTHIELPSVLPDLRSLEDIVDRRKLFYIPRI